MIPLLIFGLTYLVVAGQRIPGVRLDRPSGALCGAVLMVLCGALTTAEAYAAINLDTLALLFGMMVIAGYLAEAAFFRHLAYLTVRHARSARRLLCGLVALVGLLSAFLVNDVVCLMCTPIVLLAARQTGLPPLPYLLAVATASNIGGVMTLVGNPQNMIIGTTSGLSYPAFFLRMLPVGVLGLAADALLLLYLFRKELPRDPLPLPDIPPPPLDRRLLGKALLVLGLVVGGFLGGRSMAGMAMAGAALLTLIARTAPRPVFARVDGSLLLFFAGLFVVIEGAAKTGALAQVHTTLLPWFGASVERQLVTFGLFTEIASNLFSNVPFVLVAREWMPKMASPEHQWIGLAMTSTLAGNLTLVGSVANLIVFELAGPECSVGFFRFLRYGAPITLVTTAIGLAVLLLELRLGW